MVFWFKVCLGIFNWFFWILYLVCWVLLLYSVKCIFFLNLCVYLWSCFCWLLINVFNGYKKIVCVFVSDWWVDFCWWIRFFRIGIIKYFVFLDFVLLFINKDFLFFRIVCYVVSWWWNGIGVLFNVLISGLEISLFCKFFIVLFVGI